MIMNYKSHTFLQGIETVDSQFERDMLNLNGIFRTVCFKGGELVLDSFL